MTNCPTCGEPVADYFEHVAGCPGESVARERVQSSNIYAIGYDTDARKLFVEFHARKDGLRAVYAYEDVGPHVYEQLRTAASIGREFRVVRDNYIGRLVAHVDAAGNEHPAEIPT